MKPIVYTEGNRYGQGIVTICLMKKYSTFVRGVSLCSRMDYPDGNEGKNKAEGRAHKAFKQKKSTLPINRNEAIRLLFETGTHPFKFKSEFDATLTTQEKLMVS